MKIILIYPPTAKNSDYNTPTGLLYIGTVLRNYGCNVNIIDCSVEPDYENILQKEVQDTDILGVYAMSIHIKFLLPLLKQLKQLNEKMLIVWGGPHAILFPEQTAKSKYADIVCKGEGEEVMLEIVKNLESGTLNLNKINGIAFSEDNKIVSNPYREFVDIKKLPFIDWTFIRKNVMEKIKVTICRVQASRGCPYRCAFCINVLTNNQTMRYRDPKDVLDEIESLYNHWGVKRIGFRDEIFMSNRQQVKEIAQGLIDRNINITWLANPRAEYLRERYIDDKYLQLLADSGCTKLQCGGESGSERILKLLKKGIKVKDIYNFVRRCKKFNIIPLVAFMTGIPSETKKEQLLTLRVIRDLLRIEPRTIINGPANYRPYPGGELYDLCINQYNLKMPDSLEEWAKAEILGGNRPPWIKTIYFNSFLWTSIKAASHTTEYLKNQLKKNPLKGLIQYFLSKISRFRLERVFYKFPFEFRLMDWYYRFIIKKVPDYS